MDSAIHLLNNWGEIYTCGRKATTRPQQNVCGLTEIIEDVSINNEYEYENDFKPYSYSKSFSQLSVLTMTPSSSL